MTTELRLPPGSIKWLQDEIIPQEGECITTDQMMRHGLAQSEDFWYWNNVVNCVADVVKYCGLPEPEWIVADSGPRYEHICSGWAGYKLRKRR